MGSGVLLFEAIANIKSFDELPSVLLHTCCAPCAASVIQCLSEHFRITIFFYNPNIKAEDEYFKRAGELQKLLSSANFPNIEDVIVCDYNQGEFDFVAAEYMDEPEGGKRCSLCFELRLRKSAEKAGDGFDYFASTLSVSPHKNAAIINQIGCAIAEQGKAGTNYLISDFKKRGGYQRSVELSKQFGLYRQRYCGCTLTNN